MQGSLSLVTAPTVEPLSVAEAKAHCRVTDNSEDVLFERRIKAAREHVEGVTGRALITQAWDWKHYAFPSFPRGGLEVPRPNLLSVTSITYLDTSGVSTTWSSSNYRVTALAGPRAEPGRIALAYGISVPATYGVSDAVTIRFSAGYGPAASDVPSAIFQAMLLLIGEMTERREAALVGTSSTKVELAVESLLSPYVITRWARACG